MIMSLEQKMLTQPAKVNSPRRDTRTALDYVSMNVVVAYFSAVICHLWLDLMENNQPPWVWIQHSVPTLVLVQNHSDHRDNIVGLTRQLKRIEHKLRLTVCCLLFIPIKDSWKVPSFNKNACLRIFSPAFPPLLLTLVDAINNDVSVAISACCTNKYTLMHRRWSVACKIIHTGRGPLWSSDTVSAWWQENQEIWNEECIKGVCCLLVAQAAG